MIYEVIVSTLNSEGLPNWAPMGLIEQQGSYFLHVFKGSHTYENLMSRGEFVANATDDILAFCLSALGEPTLDCVPAKRVAGYVYAEACSWMEFEAVATEEDDLAGRFSCRLLYSDVRRSYRGYNRAKGSIMELLIAATRYRLYDRQFFNGLILNAKALVERTGGEREAQALAFVEGYLEEVFDEGRSR
ncbi:hypothetical protein SAMN05444368_1980 [Acetomicrobium flavidum]|uniref:DUF447 family protein n=1 Tax=Acetomicrobium flavidum TaxID=49896 RepID=A0ABY1JFK8_9BACT|nr:hypothetical protein SAMN05444368_1980 [Acetomicrobium flavidum]